MFSYDPAAIAGLALRVETASCGALRTSHNCGACQSHYVPRRALSRVRREQTRDNCRTPASKLCRAISQPTVHRYSKIGWRSTVLRDRAAPQKLSSAATPRRIPHADRPFGPLISGWAPKAFPCRKQTQSCVPSAVYERRELGPHCPDSCRCVSCLHFRYEAG